MKGITYWYLQSCILPELGSPPYQYKSAILSFKAINPFHLWLPSWPHCFGRAELSSLATEQAYSRLESFGSFSGRKAPLIISLFNNFFVGLKHTLLSLTSHLCFVISISAGETLPAGVRSPCISLTAFAIAALLPQKLLRGLHLPACLNSDDLGASGAVSAIQKREGKKTNVWKFTETHLISVPLTCSLGRNRISSFASFLFGLILYDVEYPTVSHNI